MPLIADKQGMAHWRSPVSRREFLGTAGALVAPPLPARRGQAQQDVIVNDLHSQLNETRVRRILTPRTADEVQAAVRAAASDGAAVSLCGSRHAMGGQQFGADTVLIDLRSLNRVARSTPNAARSRSTPASNGPRSLRALVERQQGRTRQWGIAQKQTGADRLTIGGALSANMLTAAG